MGSLLWKPDETRVNNSNMMMFLKEINSKYDLELTDYPSLYEWSVTNIADFWETMWDFTDIIYSEKYSEVVDDSGKMPGAEWFTGSKLNFAENLLKYRDDQTAIISRKESGEHKRLTYRELYREVSKVASALRREGVVAGDRVVGFMPNIPETIIAMLAATSIGAVWSSCSPDFGIKGVLDRFGQTEPKVLYTADGYYFKGKKLDSIERISNILKKLPSIKKTVVVPFLDEHSDISPLENGVHLKDFTAGFDGGDIEFEQLPFNHPLYIMYSSGTTGLPKCMVQSAGGILIHHKKELQLHTDLKREDNIFYFTSCGWMMWNWLVSSLSVGATVVLFDGNPFYPDPECLWRMTEEEKITVFGTSAGYISALQTANIKPKVKHDLSSLRAVLSTGSPLSEENFKYVYDEIKQDVQLASIAGGSDLNGCFALGNPFSPVYAGWLQGRGLAMKVESFNPEGKHILNQQGELVCSAAFPSMPIYFWDDPEKKKYNAAYFDVYPGIWRHGDYIEINDLGCVKIYGRSDATLNPGGVRIGTAEIYRQVEMIEDIEDSIVVGQKWKNDERIILFVKLKSGYSLNDDLKKRVVGMIRSGASPRHIPAKIIEIPDVPYTLTMKKVEMAVKKVIDKKPVENKDALKNPEALDYFMKLPELMED